MKKLLSFCLVIVLMITAMPLGAFEFKASAATSGTTGDCIWMLDGTELTISGNGDMGNYSYNSNLPWGKSITKVMIEKGVTSIGNYAFYYCSKLISVTIPNSVTSIGGSAFYRCSSLTSITVSSSNTYCTSVDGVLFNKNKTTLICYPAGKANTSYIIPNGVTSIANTAFDGCSRLASITIPDSVTSIVGSVFFDCTSLRSVYLTNLETWLQIDFGSVQSSPFCNGAKLYLDNVLVTELIIPDSVSNIGFGAFYGCTSITTITIPNSVISIEASAFRNCSNLRSIYMGNGVASIGGHVFANCTKLTNVYYHGNEEDKTKITIGSNNSDLINSTWHYNSCVGSANHTYDGECDAECNLCGKTRIVPDHTYGDDKVCDVCGHMNFVLGNIDGTGEVDLSDVSVLAKYFAGWNVDVNEDALDCNGDGKVNLYDLVILAQFVAGWGVELH